MVCIDGPADREQPSGDLLIYGSGNLVDQLTRLALVDEYRLMIHPVLVGRGTTALRDNLRAELRLLESKTLANGVVVVSYEPIRT